jgi:hypothetical protein
MSWATAAVERPNKAAAARARVRRVKLMEGIDVMEGPFVSDLNIGK